MKAIIPVIRPFVFADEGVSNEPKAEHTVTMKSTGQSFFISQPRYSGDTGRVPSSVRGYLGQDRKLYSLPTCHQHSPLKCATFVRVSDSELAHLTLEDIYTQVFTKNEVI